jgi:hypothetical protein
MKRELSAEDLLVAWLVNSAEYLLTICLLESAALIRRHM